MNSRFCSPLRFAALIVFLAFASAGWAHGASEKKEKIRLVFVDVSFPATRETKAVSLAIYRGADATLRARFEAAQREFEQGMLRLNTAGSPTPECEEFFTSKAAASWMAIAEIPSLRPELKAAALHNVANCHTVIRRYEEAYGFAVSAAAADPAQKRFAVERDALRDGFYAKRQGFAPVTLQASRLEQIEQPASMEGVASEIALSPLQAKITPIRTIKNAVGFIWVNDRKPYQVEYREQIELNPAPLVGTLKLRNQTERVLDCRGVVVQVSINGNQVGGPKDLRWQGDPARVVPNGHVTATFAIANPKTLPSEGTLAIAVYDVPSTVSATGMIEGKRNDTFAWSITRAACAFEIMNRLVEEKITSADALNEGRPVALEARFEPLVFPDA